jgi:hypothetical protein
LPKEEEEELRLSVFYRHAHRGIPLR